MQYGKRKGKNGRAKEGMIIGVRKELIWKKKRMREIEEGVVTWDIRIGKINGGL